ncbi:hypothetical protein GALMADRAFT_160658 [Galerina marginata CBS 339.88]|uniref:F-box domain-containing protein n=1 Tax=Galerina marginata (strain CBS 339.88) TaxID=685588 RepID=A0A067SDV2_GALM3|nr:hypothetical protein GALMADRAFT_160658 [Galerina marginata CBS 339.88]
MAFTGANLTVDQLLLALKLKLENETEVNPPFDVASQRTNKESTWSNRVLESKHVTILLLRRLNAHSAVNGLPFEILGEIFLCVQCGLSNPLRRESDPPRPSTWMAMTQVCRHWRTSAHNTKALWRHIILLETQKSRANLATYFFQLSHPLPISIEHNIFNPIPEVEEEELNEFYTLLLEHPDRISALYLRGQFPDTAWNLLQMSMPNVVEVELHFGAVLVTVLEDGVPVGPSSLRPMRNGNIETFLGGQCASLRKLSLTYFTRPKTLFSALTHLYLTAEFYDPESLHPEDDFLDVLSFLSTTLEFLYIQQAGINLEKHSQSSYPIITVSERPVMRNLRWLEIHRSTVNRHDNFSLMLIYNLSLPVIKTLVWDSACSKDLTLDAAVRSRMSMIPPQELLERVTRLVASMDRERCFVLKENTLNFDPDLVTFSDLKIWHTLLPNLTMLVLSPDSEQYDYRLEIRDLLKTFKTLKYLHFGAYTKATSLLSDLEKNGKGGSTLDFLPNLELLAIYTGNHDIAVAEIRNKASEWLVQRRLQPLELTTSNSMTRARCHLGTAYTLRYTMGSIYGYTF